MWYVHNGQPSSRSCRKAAAPDRGLSERQNLQFVKGDPLSSWHHYRTEITSTKTHDYKPDNISGIYKKDNRDVFFDTSNYVLTTSNNLILKADVNDTNSSNYVAITSEYYEALSPANFVMSARPCSIHHGIVHGSRIPVTDFCTTGGETCVSALQAKYEYFLTYKDLAELPSTRASFVNSKMFLREHLQALALHKFGTNGLLEKRNGRARRVAAKRARDEEVELFATNLIALPCGDRWKSRSLICAKRPCVERDEENLPSRSVGPPAVDSSVDEWKSYGESALLTTFVQASKLLHVLAYVLARDAAHHLRALAALTPLLKGSQCS